MKSCVTPKAAENEAIRKECLQAGKVYSLDGVQLG